ncbi:MAG TPA: transcriptional repressor [Verrucomicrobia bacterium]|nr:transcriptional repressor [Verrucomicrobiota bacterium]HOP96574.1 Fur family transcriptional regulator [Verrucomicrobiota bacterium]
MKPRKHRRARLDLPRIAERFRKKARKLTGPRRAILVALRERGGPVTPREIFRALEGRCDLATVYRSMHLLETMGMVKRYDFGDGQARFELLEEGDDGHHHHLVCRRCADVVEIEGCLMSDVDRQVAEANGFKAVTHRLEFFGICPECQGSDSRGENVTD